MLLGGGSFFILKPGLFILKPGHPLCGEELGNNLFGETARPMNDLTDNYGIMVETLFLLDSSRGLRDKIQVGTRVLVANADVVRVGLLCTRLLSLVLILVLVRSSR